MVDKLGNHTHFELWWKDHSIQPGHKQTFYDYAKAGYYAAIEQQKTADPCIDCHATPIECEGVKNCALLLAREVESDE